MSSSLSFRSTGDAGQVVTGCLKWPKKVLSSVLLVKWIMITRETWSRLLFEMLVTEFEQDIQTRSCVSHVSLMVVRIEGWTCHVSVHVCIRIEGWMCHMSKGGVLCEVTTCTRWSYMYVAARCDSWYFWSHIETVQVNYFTPL